VLALLFFVVALAGAAIQLALQKRERTRARVLEVFLVWLLATGGVGSILAGLSHIFFARQVAASIGWEPSPFQRENAFADIGYGVLGLLCIWIRGIFWEATVIMTSISLLGDAYGHVYEMVVNHDYAPNNTGMLLAMDIIGPVVLIVLLILLRLEERKERTQASAIIAS
jgi:hypothetical protein